MSAAKLRAFALGVLLAGNLLLAGCMGDGATNADAAPSAAAESAAPSAPAGVPVKVDAVRRQSLAVIVGAPGRTEALRQDQVRAPFASRVMSLRVADGDRVAEGQVLAVVVAKNSEAALLGAEQMLKAARTETDKADAKRAVEVAKASLVQQTLRAPAAGIVLSHAAETGGYANEDEVLVTLVETDTVFFDAQVAQSDVGRISAGQAAHIDLPAAGSEAVSATVHGLLPMASSQNFSSPVRLDFSPPRPDLGLGLFGTASIVVGQHENATVVPEGAVLRDDVSGVTRVAVVEAGKAHWLTVDTGLREGGRVEILRPAIEPGTRVVTDGQVGLPEGAEVAVQP
ncbi:MAG TPA: efflux RND transporter periplasmic adaptor subunit [Gammaproteobacteria bacterium]|nr:efflux RND transporter periplasmic adaptor subunit [Gammaproteobacteria bacterium]